VRSQTTLRLSPEELRTLDAAARRLHLDRAALIRASAVALAQLILERTDPLVLAVEPSALLERLAGRLRIERAGQVETE
jgi:uncharacterized protein (DUF1778 family)